MTSIATFSFINFTFQWNTVTPFKANSRVQIFTRIKKLVSWFHIVLILSSDIIQEQQLTKWFYKKIRSVQWKEREGWCTSSDSHCHKSSVRPNLKTSPLFREKNNKPNHEYMMFSQSIRTFASKKEQSDPKSW